MGPGFGFAAPEIAEARRSDSAIPGPDSAASRAAVHQQDPVTRSARMCGDGLGNAMLRLLMEILIDLWGKRTRVNSITRPRSNR